VLFCLPAKNNQLSGYYDPNSQISSELTDAIPSGISTVFWECVLAPSLLLLRSSSSFDRRAKAGEGAARCAGTAT